MIDPIERMRQADPASSLEGVNPHALTTLSEEIMAMTDTLTPGTTAGDGTPADTPTSIDASPGRRRWMLPATAAAAAVAVVGGAIVLSPDSSSTAWAYDPTGGLGGTTRTIYEGATSEPLGTFDARWRSTREWLRARLG